MTTLHENFILLAEKDNLIRLRGCDFNNTEESLNKNTKIPGSLAKIKNPILIIFYYNDTSEKILTEFYLSSLEKELERGSSDDTFFSSIRADDNDFLFGFVNLDLEKEILKTFREVDDSNPFSWSRIEESSPGVYVKEPFMMFYYQTIPQIMYEGVVSSMAIRKEFKTWRTKLKEMENKEFQKIKSRIVFEEGYYLCLSDNLPVQGMVKGRQYYVKKSIGRNNISSYTFDQV